jgi:hypothetical protein
LLLNPTRDHLNPLALDASIALWPVVQPPTGDFAYSEDRPVRKSRGRHRMLDFRVGLKIC